MGDGSLYFIRAAVGWQIINRSMSSPCKIKKGRERGTIWESYGTGGDLLLLLTSDDTPEKWVLSTVFFCLFSVLRLCAFVSFTKTCLKMIAGYKLLSKLFIKCHQYLTLAKF